MYIPMLCYIIMSQIVYCSVPICMSLCPNLYIIVSQIEFETMVPAITDIWGSTSFTFTHKRKITNGNIGEISRPKLLDVSCYNCIHCH